MKLFTLRRILLIALLLAPVSTAVMAQVTDATLKLSVADEQSNTVSGVSVDITNEDTGVKRAAVTDNNGQVTVAGLPSGSYAVSLKANGFKSFSQKNLKLNVGQMAELKIQLSVGAVEEVVNIDAGAAQLQIATEG
ncbi:MAG TPA: carboxypeptidase-like regulatory domain-containing protein, partial [Blastocatellia bacterium]|nr:carboxypeptidase-like regulatory domain-containing protein [Blastocatellia bacterium]